MSQKQMRIRSFEICWKSNVQEHLGKEEMYLNVNSFWEELNVALEKCLRANGPRANLRQPLLKGILVPSRLAFIIHLASLYLHEEKNLKMLLASNINMESRMLPHNIQKLDALSSM